MTTSDTKSVRLDGQFGNLFRVMHLVRKGELLPPKGMAIKTHTKNLLVIAVHRNAFRLESKKLAILDTTPIDLHRNCPVPNRHIKGLELRLEAGQCSVYVLWSQINRINLDPTNHGPQQTSFGLGKNHLSALAITGDVKPRLVQGGAPSLGKKK